MTATNGENAFWAAGDFFVSGQLTAKHIQLSKYILASTASDKSPFFFDMETGRVTSKKNTPGAARRHKEGSVKSCQYKRMDRKPAVLGKLYPWIKSTPHSQSCTHPHDAVWPVIQHYLSSLHFPRPAFEWEWFPEVYINVLCCGGNPQIHCYWDEICGYGNGGATQYSPYVLCSQCVFWLKLINTTYSMDLSLFLVYLSMHFSIFASGCFFFFYSSHYLHSDYRFFIDLPQTAITVAWLIKHMCGSASLPDGFWQTSPKVLELNAFNCFVWVGGQNDGNLSI